MIFQPIPAGSGGVKVASGSYVGTGTYGEFVPNTIYCGFPVKYMAIVKDEFDGTVDSGGLMIYAGQSGTLNFSIQPIENGIEFYSNRNAELQYNADGTTYFWFAIG